MKTLKTKMAIVAIFTILFSFISNQSKAQVNPPYTIVNNLSCQVEVHWEIYNDCALLCTSGNIRIQPNSSINLVGMNFGNCAPACDLKITIIKISGTAVSYGPIGAFTTNPLPFTAFAGCTGSTPQMDWTTSIAHINP